LKRIAELADTHAMPMKVHRATITQMYTSTSDAEAATQRMSITLHRRHAIIAFDHKFTT